MKVFKVTDGQCNSNNFMHWYAGCTHEIDPGLRHPDAPLCTKYWLHAYTDIRQMLLFHNSCHNGLLYPILWEAEAAGLIKYSEEGDKIGCTKLTLIRKTLIPWLSSVKSLQFALFLYVKLLELKTLPEPKITGDFVLWCKMAMAEDSPPLQWIYDTAKNLHPSTDFENNVWRKVKGVYVHAQFDHVKATSMAGGIINMLMRTAGQCAGTADLPENFNLIALMDEFGLKVEGEEVTMKAFKVTDRDMETYHNTQWSLGKEKRIDDNLVGRFRNLCCEAWFHAYADIRQVALFNVNCHTSFCGPRLFEADARGILKTNSQDKIGCTSLTLTKEIDWPILDLAKVFKMVMKLYVAFSEIKIGASQKPQGSFEGKYITAFLDWAKPYVEKGGGLSPDDYQFVCEYFRYKGLNTPEAHIRSAIVGFKNNLPYSSLLADISKALFYLVDGYAPTGFDLIKFMDENGIEVVGYEPSPFQGKPAIADANP